MNSYIVRPRLVLATTALPREDAVRSMTDALQGGDVSTVILDPAGWEPDAFQDFAASLVPVVQAAGAAAIVADDSRCAGRIGADGIHLSGGDLTALSDAIERFAPKLIVGAGGFKTRHGALEAGERLPDYMFFGRLDGDDGEEPHEKSLRMATWWAEIVEVPCIVMAGRTVDSLRSAVATGAEFIAVSRAVFEASVQPERSVAELNATIDALFESKAA